MGRAGRAVLCVGLAGLLQASCSDGSGPSAERPAPVVRVRVEPATAVVDVAGRTTFSAVVETASGATVDRPVDWSAEDTTVASPVAGAPGTVVGRGEGRTEVTATVEGVSGRATVDVREPVPPDPPADVVAVPVSDVAVELGWDDRADDESGFRVERAVGEGGTASVRATGAAEDDGWEVVAEVGANRTAHRDEDLRPGTLYRYRVRACGEVAGCSEAAELHEPVATLEALVVTSGPAPRGATNPGYRHTLRAEGGTGAYLWEIRAGSLPPGVALAPDGTIEGVPTEEGTFPVTVRVVSGEQGAEQTIEIRVGDVLSFDGNPLMWGADPAAHAWVDGRLWLYPTTDAHDWSTLTGWHAWSTSDLETWTRHRDIFTAERCGWCEDNAWALDAAYKDGWYYLYYYFQNEGRRPRGVGVARSPNPGGPYENLTPDAPLVDGHDPAVFVDDDGRAYLYVGHVVYFLDDDMASLVQVGDRDRQAVVDLRGRRPEGGFEGVWVFERDGTYYYTLADADYRRISYWTGERPTGPFRWGGVILDEVEGLNVHHSVVEYEGRWLLFFHLWPEDGLGQRRVYAEPLEFAPDGSIEPVTVTDRGIGTSGRATGSGREGAAAGR